jgi:hypothetical protein
MPYWRVPVISPKDERETGNNAPNCEKSEYVACSESGLIK